ncbi:histidine kinase [Intrasporangium calvum]|uniref:histidine kinase n=1 Tax=Intrasporangium calvum TaxID=53358 RepID=A0ABT5GIE8_9MICO|nr:histidine kinase [Intrasporangium calvum]MDC5698023.1 histidine kinase [Intrasporangium calvum]
MPLSSPPAPPAVAGRLALGRRGRTVGLGFLVLTDVVYATSAFDGRRAAAAGLTPSMSSPMSDLGLLIALVGIGLVAAVQWRQRWPVALALVGVAGVALQLGPTFALINLMWVVVTRPWKDALWVGGIVAGATGVAVWRDLVASPAATSFWRTLVAQDGQPVGWYAPVVVTLALIALFGGTGLWLRTRSQLRTAEVVVASERQAVTSLTDQVSRQTERERLAREIHDGLGHNLSILSVHAGALEAMAEAAGDDLVDRPEGADAVERRTAAQLKESAQVVRETAAKSVSELHSLLNILRNPGDADVAAPTKTLRDVRALIDDSVTAGMPLIATVYVEDGEAMDPPLAQAAYRIVQELLTNARKHAATVPVRLTMTGGRGEGQLVIGTANHLPPPKWPPPAEGAARPGTGLAGIRERVEHYGGDMQWGADAEAVFRVSVRLPWRLVERSAKEGN